MKPMVPLIKTVKKFSIKPPFAVRATIMVAMTEAKMAPVPFMHRNIKTAMARISPMAEMATLDMSIPSLSLRFVFQDRTAVHDK